MIIWGGEMKKFLISVLLVTSAFFVESVSNIDAVTQVYASSYNWVQISNYGDKEWVLYDGWQKLYGWQYVNGVWYYIYPSTGCMAHNTFVNGWYVDSNGAWTTDIPYALQRVIKIVPHPGWIYDCGTSYECEITFLPNQNLKKLAENGWNAPDVNGTVVCIDYNEFFVADDGTVFKAPHQAYDTIYQYDEDGNVVNKYEYSDPNAVG